MSKGAKITVEWGDYEHTLVLTSRNWARVKAGKPLRIRGKGYYYEGEFFWDYWDFNSDRPRGLRVEYGTGTGNGVGFDESLDSATIEETMFGRLT